MMRLETLTRILLVTLFVFIFSTPAIGADSFEKFKVKTKARFPDISWITVDNLHRWLEEKAADEIILLDVRSKEEFEVSHLAGAHLTPTLEEARSLLRGWAEGQRIVTYCAVGYRSAVLARELEEIGFANVYNLEGSLFEWANKGYPLDRYGEEVHKVHFYNLWWGRYLNKNIWAW